MRRGYSPVVVQVGESLFEVHVGPRVYRRVGTTLRKVDTADPVMLDVAKALREGVDRHKAARLAEERRRKGWKYRFGRWLARILPW